MKGSVRDKRNKTIMRKEEIGAKTNEPKDIESA